MDAALWIAPIILMQMKNWLDNSLHKIDVLTIMVPTTIIMQEPPRIISSTKTAITRAEDFETHGFDCYCSEVTVEITTTAAAAAAAAATTSSSGDKGMGDIHHTPLRLFTYSW